MATANTHPWTYAMQFDGQDAPGLISKEGFRTLLENTYQLSLSDVKRHSYLRDRSWLRAIYERQETPPAGYGTGKDKQAAWKFEIGFTNPGTSKWRCHNGGVFNAKEKNGGAPHTATEDLYILMTNIHQAGGHKGRDNFYNAVKVHSATPTKDFCNSFVNVCCEKAASYQPGGGVQLGWLPVAKAKGASPTAGNKRRTNNNNPNIDNGTNFDNSLARGNGHGNNNYAALPDWQSMQVAPAVPQSGFFDPVQPVDPLPWALLRSQDEMEIDDGHWNQPDAMEYKPHGDRYATDPGNPFGLSYQGGAEAARIAAQTPTRAGTPMRRSHTHFSQADFPPHLEVPTANENEETMESVDDDGDLFILDALIDFQWPSSNVQAAGQKATAETQQAPDGEKKSDKRARRESSGEPTDLLDVEELQRELDAELEAASGQEAEEKARLEALELEDRRSPHEIAEDNEFLRSLGARGLTPDPMDFSLPSSDEDQQDHVMTD